MPPPPARMVDLRPNRPIVLHSADVYVDKDEIIYCTGFNAYLTIIEFLG